MRRWAEIACAQFGVFLEFGGVFDLADCEDDVVDRRAAGIETGVDIFADLLDLARRSPLPTILPASSRATCPPTTTQYPPSRSATLVVGGEEAQGGPTMAGSAGRGRGAAADVCGNLIADRPAAGAACASMTGLRGSKGGG